MQCQIVRKRAKLSFYPLSLAFCSVALKVNKVSSSRTQLNLDYYSLPFCQPDGGSKLDNENLGEFLEGDRIESSPYILRMKEDMYCQKLCVTNLGRGESPDLTPSKIVKAIQDRYYHNWIVDNLPAASKIENDNFITTRYWQGFPLGFVDQESGFAFVHNHVNIEIMYHPVDYGPRLYQIVRFTVEPFSIKHDFNENNGSVDINNPIQSCKPNASSSGRIHTSYDIIQNSGAPNVGPQEASGKVLFTYDVIWVQNDELGWASRWNIYLSMDQAVPARVHWRPIFLGLIIIITLAGIIACVAVANLKTGSISSYNSVAVTDEHIGEEHGIKAVRADVFRPPNFSPFFLCVACGTGVQLLGTAFCTLLFSICGPLSEANRGSLPTSAVVLYALLGVISGYVSAMLDSALQTNGGKRLLLCTALGFPGLSFCVFILNNLVAFANRSTDAVPLTTVIVLLLLWFGVSTPLVFLGGRFGRSRSKILYPVETSAYAPRQIPNQPCFLRLPMVVILGGILPAVTCFPEFYFILSSVWLGYYYDNFGSLLVVSLVSIIMISEIMFLFHFFSLKKENYRWWWRSFVTAASPTLYASLWSFFVHGPQFATESFTAFFKYYTYMSLMLLGLCLMSGCIGVGFCFWFNMKLYGALKYEVDSPDARIELLPREAS